MCLELLYNYYINFDECFSIGKKKMESDTSIESDTSNESDIFKESEIISKESEFDVSKVFGN